MPPRKLTLAIVSCGTFFGLQCSGLCAAAADSEVAGQCFEQQPKATSKEFIDYFPMHIGDSWKYKWTINLQEHDREKVVALSVTETNQGISETGTKWHEMELLVKSESSKPTIKMNRWYIESEGWLCESFVYSTKGGLKCFRNPLTSGFQWESKKLRWTTPRGSLNEPAVLTSSIEGEVSGPEEIKVPAGKFLAMKVITYHSAGCLPVTTTRWYAPNVGLIKQRGLGDRNDLMELTEYIPARNNKIID